MVQTWHMASDLEHDGESSKDAGGNHSKTVNLPEIDNQSRSSILRGSRGRRGSGTTSGAEARIDDSI